jgi:purine-binding chemotaxis protein CheW
MSMSTNTSPSARADQPVQADGDNHELVSMTVAGQLCGVPVRQVQDVLGPQRITRVPLAPPEVAGSLNLRGRIVTAIDLRLRLDVTPQVPTDKAMSVVVEKKGELYSLIVDSVGEVLSLPAADREPVPATIDARWRQFTDGVFRLNERLLVVLNVERLLAIDAAPAH